MKTKEQANKIASRREELLLSTKRGINSMLRSMYGAHLFGARADTYIAGKSKNTLVIKTGDGEFYLVKIQKSAWEEKPNE